ncbi:hypothetical protein B9Z55_003561 [Caenorhabditis nigoni]|uniref:Uncharacterized protein n=1 Tax=Caenorhabditis nigoni TaxID=1611254 RepID=A0A2G5VRC7_9PELO|nr:hypothetical protein B9Z55_003561 [Caenorhabditis nigoni]
MPSTASTISTAIDIVRYFGQMLALFLAVLAVVGGFVDADNFSPFWFIAFIVVMVLNTAAVQFIFLDYDFVRYHLERVYFFLRYHNPKIRITDEKPLIRTPWLETIIICSSCILVVYSYIFLDQLQKRLEEMHEAHDVIARQMEKFRKFQEEIEDFDVVEEAEEAGNSKIQIEKIEILKDPLTWIICIFLFVVLALESQYWGFDHFALLFLAYTFHQTNVMMEFHRIRSTFKSYDKEALEYQKEIDQFKKFKKSRKN